MTYRIYFLINCIRYISFILQHKQNLCRWNKATMRAYLSRTVKNIFRKINPSLQIKCCFSEKLKLIFSSHQLLPFSATFSLTMHWYCGKGRLLLLPVTDPALKQKCLRGLVELSLVSFGLGCAGFLCCRSFSFVGVFFWCNTYSGDGKEMFWHCHARKAVVQELRTRGQLQRHRRRAIFL